MISKETATEILRLYRVEKWKVGTICAQLGVHRGTVKRVLRDWRQRNDGEESPRPKRPMLIDPYRPFIQETLSKYPALRASRLYRMCRERGYAGRPDHFRHVIATMRPTPQREAYLRLNRLPGEEAQVDFAHFGKMQIGNRTWPLIALVVVLSWSRRIYLRFMPSMKLSWFLLAQAEAITAFGGSPRRMMYDNARVCVLERRGDVIRFHPALLDFAHHYGFEPRAAAPYRGNEKGRVERAIRYIRESFYAARPFRDLDDLNDQARRWCAEEAAERRLTGDDDRTVADAFAEEQAHLIPLLGDPFPTDERLEARVSKSPYVRFDRNDYSVPPSLVGALHLRGFLGKGPLDVLVADGVPASALFHRRVHAIHKLRDGHGQGLEVLGEFHHDLVVTHGAPSRKVCLSRLLSTGERAAFNSAPRKSFNSARATSQVCRLDASQMLSVRSVPRNWPARSATSRSRDA